MTKDGIRNPCVHPYRKSRDIGEDLARLYNQTLEEPVPPEWRQLLAQLR